MTFTPLKLFRCLTFVHIHLTGITELLSKSNRQLVAVVYELCRLAALDSKLHRPRPMYVCKQIQEKAICVRFTMRKYWLQVVLCFYNVYNTSPNTNAVWLTITEGLDVGYLLNYNQVTVDFQSDNSTTKFGMEWRGNKRKEMLQIIMHNSCYTKLNTTILIRLKLPCEGENMKIFRYK